MAEYRSKPFTLRADPVANHAKFATSHLFQPQISTDAFISMVSPHVARGRRNLAANTILLMRNIGMNAFQTVLFPHMSGQEIKRLNHLEKKELLEQGINTRPEIERALLISEPVLAIPKQRIHYVGDIIEVMLNLHSWNREIKTEKGCDLWGRRVITYFVYDPRSKNFAPSKFCAYVSVCAEPYSQPVAPSGSSYSGMTIKNYTSIDENDRRFDGRRARIHLTDNLGMIRKEQNQDPEIRNNFDIWIRNLIDSVTIHPKGPVFLIPPNWFI